MPANAAAPIEAYFTTIQQGYSKLDSAGCHIAGEHDYRDALRALLKQLAPSLEFTNEPKRTKAGAPDFLIRKPTNFGFLTVGNIETKDIGDLKPNIERTPQMKRYLAGINNLILTDYLEFRHYVNGQLLDKPIRMGTVLSDNTLQPIPAKFQAVRDMLGYFLLRVPPGKITRAEDLAHRMADLTRYIRNYIINDFESDQASTLLHDWRARLAKDLLADLQKPEKTPEFADMFAQTLAYGLFSARIMDTTPDTFTLWEAQRLIPRTNPFLRDFFADISGPRLGDERFAGFVDDLIELLASTDMEAILSSFGKRTSQQDPVIHFYETFLASYDAKLRKARGVYYTPEPVVQYIVRSVDYLLRDRFKQRDGLASRETTRVVNRDPTVLGSFNRRSRVPRKVLKERTLPKVLVLDPACGTGTFLYAMIQLIRDRFMEQNNAGDWSEYVRDFLLPRVFGFEILMAPYAVAHFKLGLQLAGRDLAADIRDQWAYDFSSEERLQIYLTNTLEEPHDESSSPLFDMVGRESAEANRVKRDLPIMVIIGNPPYANFGMMNKGPWIRTLIEDYKKDLNEKKLNLDDDFIKFIRFGQWRIEQSGMGILAFITNNTYIDGLVHRRMRQSLLETFTDIYILNLHGSAKKQERSPDGSKDENVFDIQQGVTISIFVREQTRNRSTQLHYADLWGSRETKYANLLEDDLNSTSWSLVVPVAPSYYFVPTSEDNSDEYSTWPSISMIFGTAQNGVKTDRDALFFDADKEVLEERMRKFYSPDGMEAPFRPTYRIQDSSSYDLLTRRDRTTFDPENLRLCLYRPFDWRWLYYSQRLTSRPAWAVMQHLLAGPNIALICLRQTRRKETGTFFVGQGLINKDAISIFDIATIFPLYLYADANESTHTIDTAPSTSGGRRPNLNLAFTAEVERRLGLRSIPDGVGDLQSTFGPEDIFNYMYAIFYSPTYRTRYAEFLKKDFPRLPLTSNLDLFRTLASLGSRLVQLHLMPEDSSLSLSYSLPLPSYPVPGTNQVDAIKYTPPIQSASQGRVSINKQQYFDGVPQEVWEFKIGGYQVADKWLKDRKDRPLTREDRDHYKRIIAALAETIQTMKQVDEAIPSWPIE